MKHIKIFDTTLRDGEQSPGCSMNLPEKIEMAKQMEKLGVDIIEAGFAIASPMAAEADAIERAVDETLKAGIRCGDIWQEGCTLVGCREMGTEIRSRI